MNAATVFCCFVTAMTAERVNRLLSKARYDLDCVESAVNSFAAVVDKSGQQGPECCDVTNVSTIVDRLTEIT